MDDDKDSINEVNQAEKKAEQHEAGHGETGNSLLTKPQIIAMIAVIYMLPVVAFLSLVLDTLDGGERGIGTILVEIALLLILLVVANLFTHLLMRIYNDDTTTKH